MFHILSNFATIHEIISRYIWPEELWSQLNILQSRTKIGNMEPPLNVTLDIIEAR